MIYPLLVKINSLINKIAFFFAFFQILKQWRLKKVYLKYLPVKILCISDIKYKDILVSVFNGRDDVIIHCIQNCSNVKIAECVYTAIAACSPRIVFTIFEDIDIVDIVDYRGTILSTPYSNIVKESNIWGDTTNAMPFLSALLRFVYNLLFIKTICLTRNIKLYWCASSPFLNLIIRNMNYGFFKDEKNVIMLKYSDNITEMKTIIYDILRDNE